MLVCTIKAWIENASQDQSQDFSKRELGSSFSDPCCLDKLRSYVGSGRERQIFGNILLTNNNSRVTRENEFGGGREEARKDFSHMLVFISNPAHL